MQLAPSFLRWLVLSFVVMLIIGGGYFLYTNILFKPTLLSVVGEGKVKSPPELAQFTVSYAGTASSSQEALAAEKVLRQKIIRLLSESFGVPAQDIQVSYPQVVPYATAGGGQSYQAVNVLDVSFKRIPSVDEAVGKLYQLGDVRVSNIVLTTNNPRDLEDQALGEAFKDGKERAEKLAKASGKQLGRLVSMSGEQTRAVGTISREAIIQRGKDAPADTTPGQIEISRAITLVYEVR